MAKTPSTKKTTPPSDPRRRLPSVSVLLEQARVGAWIEVHTRPIVLDALRDALDALRAELKPGDAVPSIDAILDKAAGFLDREVGERLRPVVNATGIILHTGLGRAVLPQGAVDALAGLNRCCNLQIDLETGQRGKRNYVSERLICRLTGAEAAVIVNNNAAATLLLLSALCAGKEVIVSRGQLIEIGGSFRLPDCVHQSGAILVEVGTTNKTHLRDYEAAITERTAAVLRVNPSNYRVVGFSQEVSIAELVELKKDRPVLVIDDLGCGALIDLARFGLPHEPTVQESIAAGADLVCFSGDKLIGGPQAGIICGRKDLIQTIRKHPLTRMLRVGKMTDLVLEQTLRLFLDPETLVERNPTLRMIAAPAADLKARATRLKKRIDAAGLDGIEIRVEPGESATGGGALPATSIPTWILAVRSAKTTPDRFSAALRKHAPPVIARVADDAVLLDMRTLMDGDDDAIVSALHFAAGWVS